jgi:diguanylate cyclase
VFVPIMALDAQTLLLTTQAIALSVSAYLAIEWCSLRDRSLLYWAGGFAGLVVGCGLSPLREHSFFFGIWVANGLLVLAHLFFLVGVKHYLGRRLSRRWFLLPVPWALLLLMPDSADRNTAFAVLNALLVAMLTMRAARMLLSNGGHAATQLGWILWAHGVFYIAKTALVFLPGAIIDPVTFRGVLIQVSLVEGIVAEVLIALSMTSTLSRRRESHIASLAARDPLTGLFNRRAFEDAANTLLRNEVSRHRPATLMIFDIDHFKAVNDRYGHAAGDQLLVSLGKLLSELQRPPAATARLGGDEFAILLGGCEADEAARFGNELRRRFSADSRAIVAGNAPATLSMGAILFDRASRDLAELMHRADLALYDAKRQGRDRLCLTIDRTVLPTRPLHIAA